MGRPHPSHPCQQASHPTAGGGCFSASWPRSTLHPRACKSLPVHPSFIPSIHPSKRPFIYATPPHPTPTHLNAQPKSHNIVASTQPREKKKRKASGIAGSAVPLSASASATEPSCPERPAHRERDEERTTTDKLLRLSSSEQTANLETTHQGYPPPPPPPGAKRNPTARHPRPHGKAVEAGRRAIPQATQHRAAPQRVVGDGRGRAAGGGGAVCCARPEREEGQRERERAYLPALVRNKPSTSSSLPSFRPEPATSTIGGWRRRRDGRAASERREECQTAEQPWTSRQGRQGEGGRPRKADGPETGQQQQHETEQNRTEQHLARAHSSFTKPAARSHPPAAAAPRPLSHPARRPQPRGVCDSPSARAARPTACLPARHQPLSPRPPHSIAYHRTAHRPAPRKRHVISHQPRHTVCVHTRCATREGKGGQVQQLLQPALVRAVS